MESLDFVDLIPYSLIFWNWHLGQNIMFSSNHFLQLYFQFVDYKYEHHLYKRFKETIFNFIAEL